MNPTRMEARRQWTAFGIPAIRKFLHSDLPTAVFFLLPSILVLGIFSIYPIVEAIRLSFFRWDNLAPVKEYIGLSNYIALANSSRFWNSMLVTAKYSTVVTIVSISVGLVLAVALNNRYLALKSFWRSLYFLPIVTPTVAAAMVWILLFNPGFGYVNVLLRSIHLPTLNWLADRTWALPTVMTLGIWRRLGFNMILYLAAIQSLPQEVYESAEVDGANAWQRFRYMTIPLLRGTTVMLIILGVIDSFLTFDQVLVLTRGGPANATEVIGMFMYSNSFSLFKLGYGSAISVVMFLAVALFTLLQWRVIGIGTHEEG